MADINNEKNVSVTVGIANSRVVRSLVSSSLDGSVLTVEQKEKKKTIELHAICEKNTFTVEPHN